MRFASGRSYVHAFCNRYRSSVTFFPISDFALSSSAAHLVFLRCVFRKGLRKHGHGTWRGGTNEAGDLSG